MVIWKGTIISIFVKNLDFNNNMNKDFEESYTCDDIIYVIIINNDVGSGGRLIGKRRQVSRWN